MPKRVSLKGKGADIFFGDYTPPAALPVTEPERTSSSVTPDSPPAQAMESILESPSRNGIPSNNRNKSKNARKKESMHTRMDESVHASSSSTPQDLDHGVEGDISPEVLDSIWQQLTELATLTNAFRYTDRELSALTDAAYELSKRHQLKLSKQDIARLGLNAVLWDYQTRGTDSLLTRFVLRKKSQRGG